MELIKPGLQSSNRSNNKASWLQQQLSSPLRNVGQTFCLSTCTESQTAVQSDAFIAIKINTLSVKANIGLLLDSKPAVKKLPSRTRYWLPSDKPGRLQAVTRQRYQKPLFRMQTK